MVTEWLNDEECVKNRGQESVCRLVVEVGLGLTGRSLAAGISRGEVDRSRKGGRRARAAARWERGSSFQRGWFISTITRHGRVIAVQSVSRLGSNQSRLFQLPTELKSEVDIKRKPRDWPAVFLSQHGR